MTTPLCRMAPQPRQPTLTRTRVTRPVDTEDAEAYESNLAALLERIKAKEKASQEQDDDDNTVLGHTRDAEVVKARAAATCDTGRASMGARDAH